jgi:hypothetical protein
VAYSNRSDGSAAHNPKKATRAPPNATKVDSVAIHPAVRREMRPPATVIVKAPTSGDSRHTQAAAITI